MRFKRTLFYSADPRSYVIIFSFTVYLFNSLNLYFVILHYHSYMRPILLKVYFVTLPSIPPTILPMQLSLANIC